MREIEFESVFDLETPSVVAFMQKDPCGSVFREDVSIVPQKVGEIAYIPWGEDNQMPFDILDLIEKDETMTTCQDFNSEVCYGSGLCYSSETGEVPEDVDNFFFDNDIPSYFMGVCRDIKTFGFAVTVLILSRDGQKVAAIQRKEACYCRFAPTDANNHIPEVLYGNWRNALSPEEIERIPMLPPHDRINELRRMAERGVRKVAVVSRISMSDSTYYPIPSYASLFRSKWYNIKRLIAVGKESKLKSAAPIKYHIEIARQYWTQLFAREKITSEIEKKKRMIEEKKRIIDFLTGIENSGKVWFSEYYTTPDGRECHDVLIRKIETSKEGGDWETDIQEAINMICFAMRVHSNLVGSVPGKAQTNNSGSDKRELYTIAQAMQKPYRDILFYPHKILIKFNGWRGIYPECPFLQLTTLDKHTDVRTAGFNK